MLMFISFPVIISQWVALDSLVSSSKNDVLSDQHVTSIAKPVGATFFIFTHLVLKLKEEIQCQL